jgi:glycosyltransferase involved in cell wall biosynthesis
MGLRILHIGNIANNAYNIAKALREKTDIEADVFTNSYNHYISQPEWEDVDFEPVQYDEFAVPDWSRVDLKGFKRPDWYFEVLDSRVWNRLGNFHCKEMLRIVESFCKIVPFLKDAKQIKKIIKEGKPTQKQLKILASLNDGLTNTKLNDPVDNDYLSYLKVEYERFFCGILTPLTMGEMKKVAIQGVKRTYQRLFSKYDIIQAYGVWEPMYPLLLAPSVPLVTFEHGSMREHPFMAETVGRLLALAYKKAYENIVTNGDSIHAIKRLGLDNYVFIPHPVDDTKFRPRETALRKKLQDEYGCSFVLFAPARQNWHYKGNDKVFRAFASLLKYFGHDVIKLFVSQWGQEVERSKQLISELGIERDVIWLPPLCKPRLVEYYNASEVVLDQFTLGTFGTTTPEAMACGRPVLSFYKPDDHEWCFKEHPPVISAYSSDEIYESVKELIKNPGKLENVCKASLQWYKRNHSLNEVVSKLVDIYKDIKDSPATVTIPFEYKKKYLLGELSKMRKVIAVIKCKRPSLRVKNRPQYLREVCGKPLIQVMADRLAKIPIRKVVLVTNEEEPETIRYAKGLGWKVVIYQKRRVGDAISVLRIMQFLY